MVNWNLLAPALQSDPGGNFTAAFERGAARGALAQISNGSDDPRAWAILHQLSPETALRMREHQYQQDERRRVAEGRSALADYVLGDSGAETAPGVGVNALAMLPQAVAPTSANGGAAPGSPDALAQAPNALIGVPAITPSAANLPGSPGSPVLAPKGSDAWTRAVRSDPDAALQVQGRRFQNQRQRVQLTQDQFELLRDVNEETLRLLGGIEQVPPEQRQAAWTAAIGEARQLYGRIGVDLTDRLPEQYDPATYDRLMRAAMKTRDQFAIRTQERRLDWDIEDDQIDNARADRGMDSLIGYRRGQLENTRRGQDLTHQRGLRGQDLSSADRRRGQDLSSGDRRRGQDLRGSGSRGRGRGRAGGNSARAVLNGRAIVVRGNRWVYEDTGQPAQ